MFRNGSWSSSGISYLLVAESSSTNRVVTQPIDL
jgi:hypothetical protein